MFGGIFGSKEQKQAWAEQEAADADEQRELNELHAMLGKPKDALPLGMYVRLQVAHENREKANEVRAEREDVRRQLEQRRLEQNDRILRLRAERGERDRDAIEANRQEKAENVYEMRQAGKARDRRRAEEAEYLLQIARARAAEARALDGKLDAREAEQDRMEQAEAREAKRAREAALKQAQHALRQKKHTLAMQSRMAHQKHAQSKEMNVELKKQQADATRHDKRLVNDERRHRESARMEHVREMKRVQLEAKARARQKRQEAIVDRIATVAHDEQVCDAGAAFTGPAFFVSLSLRVFAPALAPALTPDLTPTRTSLSHYVWLLPDGWLRRRSSA